YIEGFLASNPAIETVQVEETSCGAGSTNICEFTIG
ncbi:MAG: putative hydrocarbon binding protein, partial [Psychrobacter glaciei]